MDEAEHLLFHRWLSLCRLLMLEHPRRGADLSGITLGTTSRYRLGWNRVRLGALSSREELFVFIGPYSGQTTPRRPPVPDSEIYEVDPRLPPLASTRVWQLAQAVAAELEKAKLRRIPRDRIRQVMNAIEQAGRSDGVTHDSDVLRAWMRYAMPRMRDAMRRGDLGAYLGPAFNVVRSYLAFELPGMLARELLAVLLSVQCNIPRLGSPGATPPPARAHAIEHLADLTYRLRQARLGKQVTPYYELTYLMHLYAGACAVLAAHAREITPSESTGRLAKIALQTEEIAAHGSAPAFVLPAMFGPRDTVAWLRRGAAQRRQPVRDLARFYCVYPAYERLIAANGTADADRHFQRFARTQAAYDVAAELDRDLSPVAAENAEKIVRDLVAMSLGRGAFGLER